MSSKPLTPFETHAIAVARLMFPIVFAEAPADDVLHMVLTSTSEWASITRTVAEYVCTEKALSYRCGEEAELRRRLSAV